MENIITKIHNIIKDTDNLIAFEETIRNLMDETFTELVSDAFTHLNKAIKESTNKEEYSVERNNSRTIQFSFGAVTYNRTLIKNNRLNESFYPLDKWLGFRKYQRYSPFVKVKGAESMVKVKQGMLNGTLREVYLIEQKRSKRKQREVIKTVHKFHYFRHTKHVNNSSGFN